jgi:Domain of unknown function (DUF4386)
MTVARVAGVLYLVVFVCGIFSEVVVRSSLIESDDAAATAENILGSEWLFRIGFVSDLVVFLADAALAVLFYVLLRPVNRTLALTAAAFRLAQTAILGLNLLNHYMALQVLRADAYAGLSGSERDALAYSYLDAHSYGYLIGLAFFGVNLAILGYLVYRAPYFPRFLGVLLGLAAIGYLVDTLMFVLVPDYGGALSPVVLAPAVIAELAMIVWLLVKGVDLPSWNQATRPQPATGRAEA